MAVENVKIRKLIGVSLCLFCSLNCLNVGSSQLILHCKTIIPSMYREAGKVVGEVEVRGKGNLGNGVSILFDRVSWEA